MQEHTERPRSRTGWLPTILIVALFCTISYFAALWITPENTRVLSGAVELPVYATQKSAPLGTGVAYYDGTLLYALNGSGAQKWSYLAGANAGFHVGEGGVATWTGAQSTLLHADTGNTEFSVTMAAAIQSARAGVQYVAVLTGDEKNSRLNVLDRTGKQVDSIDTANVTVLDYGFFNNGNLLWLMTLDTTGTTPMSRLSTYKPGKMQTGSITDSDQVVYRALFYSTKLRAVGTTYMRTYDYTGAEDKTDRMLLYGWYLQDIYGAGEDPLMVFVPMEQTGGASLMQDVRISQGGKERTIRMPYECFDIYAGNGVVYGFTRDYLITGTIDSASTTVYRMSVPAEDILGVTSDFKAMVASGGKVYLVQLP